MLREQHLLKGMFNGKRSANFDEQVLSLIKQKSGMKTERTNFVRNYIL